MEENVRRELDTLKGMVLTWMEEYRGWAPPDGDGEFLAQEFREEIETHVCPYIRRMHECEYLSRGEVADFLDFCRDRVEALRKTLAEAKAG
jgi:hypothetical protein